MKTFRCDYEVTYYIPDSYWASGIPGPPNGLRVIKGKSVDQMNVVRAMDDLLSMGFKETRTITRTQRLMSVFHHEDLGWRVVCTSVAAPL